MRQNVSFQIAAAANFALPISQPYRNGASHRRFLTFLVDGCLKVHDKVVESTRSLQGSNYLRILRGPVEWRPRREPDRL